MLRAIETSVILANQLDLDFEIVDALREYDCGILEGRSDEVSWQLWQELFDAWVLHKHWEQRIEGGESFNPTENRPPTPPPFASSRTAPLVYLSTSGRYT